ncbi:MAG: asparaginase [Myxococcota bacterium]
MTHADDQWPVLVEYRRGRVSENRIFGAVAWAHGDDAIHQVGPDAIIYGRSCLKPTMVRVFADELEQVLTNEQRALAVASHNGWNAHVEVARSMLAERDHSLLQTPQDLPLVPGDEGRPTPDRWRNNGSGLHAAVLRGCAVKGWPQQSYTSTAHPFYEAHLGVLREWLGEQWQPDEVATDGDGLPTVTLRVSELARCYAGLTRTRERDWIWNSMVAHPEMVGGRGRLDTALLAAGGGALIAKEGADGLLAVGVVHPSFPEGLGLVIKIAHGWDPRASWWVIQEMLLELGVSLPDPPALRRQSAHVVAPVRGHKERRS